MIQSAAGSRLHPLASYQHCQATVTYQAGQSAADRQTTRSGPPGSHHLRQHCTSCTQGIPYAYLNPKPYIKPKPPSLICSDNVKGYLADLAVSKRTTAVPSYATCPFCSSSGTSDLASASLLTLFHVRQLFKLCTWGSHL
ncbi:TPA: hypothetical protein ACH3X1_006046 [Trebouxia sp. C0004]